MNSTEPRPWFAFALAAGLITVSLLVLYSVALGRNKRAAFADAQQLTKGVATVFADQLGHAAQGIDIILQEIVSGAIDDNVLPDGSGPPPARAFLIVDASGRIIHASSGEASGWSVADREWFKDLGAAPVQGLRLGTPEQWQRAEAGADAPLSHGPDPPSVIPLARAILGPANEFQGAAIALLDIEQMARMAQRYAQAFRLRIRLRTGDGVLIARSDGRSPFPASLEDGERARWTRPPAAWDGVWSGRDGREVIAALAHSDPGGFLVEAVMTRAEVLRQVKEHDVTLALEIGAAAAAAVALSLLLLQMLALQRRTERLESREREARAASQAKEEFLAVISHEIRTPVSGVIGVAELLLDTRLEPLQRRYAEALRSSAEHLLMLLNDILDFSKLKAGMVTHEEISFSLEREVAMIVEIFGSRAAEKGVELICALAPDLPAQVVGDPRHLRQVLFNLVGNAVKFTETGWIQLALSAEPLPGADDGYRLNCVVADTGIGIDPERIPLLFDRFTQADASISRRYGGTGLGLAICRRLVETMGGSIDANPRAGGGSVFRFDIRLGRAAGQDATIAEAARHSLLGRRVLVVDDLPLSRDVLARQLQAMGAAPAAVGDRETALAALRTALEEGRPFAAVVLDSEMPAPAGLALAREIRAANLPVSLVLCLGSITEAAQDALQSGIVNAFLLKPVLPARLHAAMLKALGMVSDTGSAQPSLPERIAEPVADAAAFRVLLAEDNLTNRLVLHTRLQRLGMQVDVAADGLEAVAAAERTAYDAIVLDLQMPVMDGLEAARRIRAGSGPNRMTRIIGLTAAVGPAFERQCRKAGMDDYLSKPASLKDLLRVLGRPMHPPPREGA